MSKFLANSPKPKVLLIAGLTGIGKTSISLNIAQMFKERGLAPEIINIDPVQALHTFSIGSAVPSKHNSELFPHHLFQFLDPYTTHSIGEYIPYVHDKIQGVISRGGTPIVVGGAPFYIQALWKGYSETPSVDRNLQQTIQDRLDQLPGPGSQWEKALNVLEMVDPVYAASLSPNDFYRLLRALEVFEVTGKPLSSFNISEDNYPAVLDYDMRAFVLHPPTTTNGRFVYFDAVYSRIMKMFNRGIFGELMSEMIQKNFVVDSSIGRSIGYRECIQYFFGMYQYLESIKWNKKIALVDHRDLNFLVLKRLFNSIASSTRQYSRKQATFYRKQSIFHHPQAWIQLPLDEIDHNDMRDRSGRMRSEYIDDPLRSINIDPVVSHVVDCFQQDPSDYWSGFDEEEVHSDLQKSKHKTGDIKHYVPPTPMFSEEDAAVMVEKLWDPLKKNFGKFKEEIELVPETIHISKDDKGEFWTVNDLFLP